MSLIYGSVCSGIEAATVAWHSLGWQPAWFSEIEKFPCKVLQQHYPNIPNLGNMLKLETNETFKESVINLLVGGTPCQSFSVAGLRAGLNSGNGNLALQFCRLLIAKQPRWFVWENVPGVLSSKSNGSSDFARILTAFRECGYSCAYRILDAQYIGVPQRRRRIFVVGYFGNDWRPPAQVLFEPNSMQRNPEKGKKKRQDVAGTLNARTKRDGFPGTDESLDGYIQPWPREITNCFDTSFAQKWGLDNQHINSGSSFFVPQIFNNQVSSDSSMTVDEICPTLDKSKVPSVCNPLEQITSKENRSNMQPGDAHFTLTKGSQSCLVDGLHVRRLTPMECERLQGFPDNYTNITGAKDSPRYKAIGNSMAVPVMCWIGNRIDKVDKMYNT